MRYLSFRIWITQDEYFQLCLSENFIISFFNTGIIAHCINTQHFFLFISCWTSRLLFFPGYYEQRMYGCMDEQVICVVGSFGYKPKGGIAGWCGGSIFPIFFCKTSTLMSTVVVSDCTHNNSVSISSIQASIGCHCVLFCLSLDILAAVHWKNIFKSGWKLEKLLSSCTKGREA